MDEFTEKYLKEWGFDYLVSRFKEEEIDRLAFLDLTELMVARLIPKMGPQSKFLKFLRTLREEIQRDKEIASTESSISASGVSGSLNLIDIGNIANFKILTTQENFNSLAAEEILLHSILGFVESFVANYHCRFCKTHKKECHQQSIQNDNSLRDSVNYTADVMYNDVSVTGIKEPCIWNDVGSFNVTTNYSVDIMHDMAKGVCKYDIGLILKEIIYNLKYFSLDTLNNRIESFNYGPVYIRSRPTFFFFFFI